jgi:hypothetical protein
MRVQPAFHRWIQSLEQARRQNLFWRTPNFTMEVTRMQESGFKPVGAIAFMVAMVLFYALVWLISYAFVIAWR